MGNQTSRDAISNFSIDTLVLDSILNELPGDNVNLSVERIRSLKIDDLKIFSDKIFEKGITHHYCSEKYAELASKLCERIPPMQFAHEADWTLNDFINRKAQYYFEVLKELNEDGMPLTNDRAYGISKLIGNLYNFELIASEKIFLWISQDAYPNYKQVQATILITIKDKVVRLSEDQNQVCSDPFIWELVDFLNKERIIKQKSIPPIQRVTQPPKPSNSNEQQKTTASAQELPAYQQLPSTSSSSSNTPTHSNKITTKAVRVSLPNEFEQHMQSLGSSHIQAFDIQKFKTCSESDRRECASRFIKFALKDSSQAQALAILALSILQLNMKATNNIKTFINYLSDECEAKLTWYKNSSRVNWVEMEAFGITAGELYNLEVLRIFIMNTWLENTKKMADTNDLALKMLFKVVKLIYSKMKSKDIKTLTQMMKHLESYKNNNRIPVAYVNWYNNVGKTPIQNERSRSRSIASNVSHSSRASSAKSEQSSTGAIKKEPKPIPVNPETIETCDKFRKFLTQLQQKGEAQYDIVFDSATDVALRGCALLLVEHTLINDDQMGMLVNISKMIIKSFKKEDRKRIFCANLKLYVYAEIEKCLKTEKPASSNWSRSESLGKYIAILYEQSVVEKTMVKAWLTKLEFMATIGSEEAAKVFYSTFSSVAEKFKLECPREFQQFQQFSNREKPKQILPVIDDNKHASSLLLPDEMRDFNIIISNLNTVTFENVYLALEKLNIDDDREKMEMLSKIFFNMFVNQNGNPVYAHLAVKINELLTQTCSFKSSLESMALREFNRNVDRMRTKADKNLVDRHARCIGELYNIGWINQALLIECFDRLSGNNFESINHVQVFRNLLKNVSFEMARRGHGDCENYYKILKEKSSSMLDTFDFFLRKETMEILESVWKTSKLSNSNNIDAISFEDMLRKLTNENLGISVCRIKLMSVADEDSMKEITEVFIDHCIANPDQILIAVKFFDGIKELQVFFIDGTTSLISHQLTINCQQKFLQFTLEGFKLKDLSRIMAFFQLQAELFNTNISSAHDMTFYLKGIFSDLQFCDNKIDCVDYFLRAIGLKFDTENRELFNEYFIKLKSIKKCSDYVKSSIKNLVKHRENNWFGEDEFELIEFSLDDLNKIEQSLKDLKDEEVAKKCHYFKRHVLQSETSVNEFIFILFKCNLHSPDFATKTAHLCKLIVAGEPSEMKAKFVYGLNQFMRSRTAPFSFRATKQDIDEKFRQKLSNIILFNAELFTANIVDEKTVEQWMIPSFITQLSLMQISTFCLLVSPKIDEGDNIHLKARLLNLESVLNEKLFQTCSQIKENIGEIESSFTLN